MSVMVRGLKKIYGDHVAVVDLHLSVQPKEIYGLLGPDGAGKTTALRCLAGVMMPSAGQIKIAGQDVTQDPERGRLVVGYLPQQFSLYGDLTVEENLQFLAQVRGLTGAQSAARIDQMLQVVRLSEHRKKLAAELSGGMKQKLALCAALLHEPSVIILDEPTAGVDPFSRREFWELLLALRDEGAAVIVSTPYLEEAEKCSRVGFLLQGRLIREGAPAELRAAYQDEVVAVLTREAFRVQSVLSDLGRGAFVRGHSVRVLGRQGLAEQVRVRLQASNCHWEDVQVVSPALEDVLIANLQEGGGGFGGN
jgi:ABC-2 type transport system ATP-binding protein